MKFIKDKSLSLRKILCSIVQTPDHHCVPLASGSPRIIWPATVPSNLVLGCPAWSASVTS